MSALHQVITTQSTDIKAHYPSIEVNSFKQDISTRNNTLYVISTETAVINILVR